MSDLNQGAAVVIVIAATAITITTLGWWTVLALAVVGFVFIVIPLFLGEWNAKKHEEWLDRQRSTP